MIIHQAKIFIFQVIGKNSANRRQAKNPHTILGNAVKEKKEPRSNVCVGYK